MSLVFPEILSSIWLLFPIQPMKILTKFLIIFNSDFLPVFRQFSLLKVTFSFQFVRLLTSRFSNYNYWGIVLLYTKIQKFSSILSGVPKYHKKVCFARFSVFYYQNVCQSHFMPQQAIALIFLPVIEHIKFYYLGYLTISPRENSQALLIKSHLFPIIDKICVKMLVCFL